MTDLSRYAGWTAWLTARVAVDADVRAARVGGPAATGGYDEWSDLDVDVLCTPELSERCFAWFDELLGPLPG